MKRTTKILTARINEIEAKVEFLLTIPVDDFTASICLSEIEDLLAEKMSLEMLMITHVDVKCSSYHSQKCTGEFDIVKAILNIHLN
jgi:hypothetical protein